MEAKWRQNGSLGASWSVFQGVDNLNLRVSVCEPLLEASWTAIGELLEGFSVEKSCS